MVRGYAWLVAALAGAVAGCDGEALEGLVFAGASGEDLVGFYTGVEEITGERDLATSVPPGNPSTEGFSFPVALRLDPDAGFELRSFNYPVSADPEERVCAGVWEVEGNNVHFFPDRACRVLPLNRYRIGRSFPEGLLLEASTSFPGSVGQDVANIRVRLRLERD